MVVYQKRERAIRLAGATRNFLAALARSSTTGFSNPGLTELVACCEMFSKIPTAASVGTNDEPP